MKPLILIFGLLWQTSALAEVSDKMLTIPEFLGQGLAVAAVVFFFSYLRWWLALIASPLAALFFFGTYSLWQEQAMRQALLHEQGISYFIAMLIADTTVFLGMVVGGCLAWRRRANP